MLKTLTLTAVALTIMTSTATAKPKHCEPNAQAWWLQYATVRGVVDLSRSVPEFGVAYMVWPNGFEQVVRLSEHKGRYCTFPVQDNVRAASASN